MYFYVKNKRKHREMKVLKIIFITAVLITQSSCGGLNDSTQPANAEGFGAIEQGMKSKFGKDAYYTSITIMHDKFIGNMISLTQTNAPESLKMEEWNQSQNTWKQNSEISIEVPEGSKASDFMFQLNDEINLRKLGELVEESSKQLEAEKELENPTLSLAFVKFPKNGDMAKAEYSINLKPENGGTTFTFMYTLSGELIKMDY